MDVTNEEIVQAIRNYQERLEKYVQKNNEEKILYYLNKLKKLPIKTVHLETTGVGRSVNALKKLGGTVGSAAKEVVAAWKIMVLAEEKAAEENNDDEEEEEEDEEEEEEEEEEEANQSDSGKSDTSLKVREASPEVVEKREEPSTSKSKEREREKKHKSHKKKYSGDSDNERSHRKRQHNSDDSDEDSERSSKRKKHRKDNESDEDRKHKSKKSKHHHHKHSSKREELHEKSHKSKHKESKSKSHKKDKERKSDEKHHHSKSSSSSTKNKEKVETVVVKSNEKMINGIDSGSGASFAEALGMCGPLVTNKNKSKKSSSSDKEKPSTSQNKATPTSSKVPDMLKESELEPLNINIDNLLPEITPNYRPLGLPLDSGPKRFLTDDEALSRVMSNKNQKTKVYSGNKVRGKIETLFDLCVRILQDNIDALEYTGGVPYSILKPIIEKATPDQLFNLEHHNPYLIEDTNELWQLHCQREFRNKQREEMESWREMYMRCLEEREARLNAITANIKQSQDKSLPVRTTKLAYVDSVAKPPRNIARKQMKNGIPNVEQKVKTAVKLSALATSGEAGKISVPNPGHRAVDKTSSNSSSGIIKPKKAPLMAKTLSFLKNRFRR